MDEEKRREPFEKPNSFSVSGGAEFQPVLPPRPPLPAPEHEGDGDTKPIPVVVDSIGPDRYHLYDLVVRLRSVKQWPRWYRPCILVGIVGASGAAIATIDTHQPLVTVSLVALFALLLLYPFTREVYGWRHRTNKITKVRNGIRIDIEEPQSGFFLYVGGNSFEVIEGSLRVIDKRRVVNKYVFWGSGTIAILDKIEDEKKDKEKTRLVNIRRFGVVYDFLAQSVGV